VIALSPHMAACAVSGWARADAVRLLPNGIDPAEIGLGGETDPGGIASPALGPGPLQVLFVGTLARHRACSRSWRLAGSCAPAASLRGNARRRRTGRATGPQRNPLARSGQRRASRGGAAAGLSRRAVPRMRRPGRPSLSEPLPTVALEALAAGRPVVGANVGGIPFLVRAGVNGLLFPPGDAAALAGELSALATTAALLRGCQPGPGRRSCQASRGRRSAPGWRI